MIVLVLGAQNYCTEYLTVDGNCGDDGAFQCALDFLAKYGARAMPQHCTCAAGPPNQKICKCDKVCGPPKHIISA